MRTGAGRADLLIALAPYAKALGCAKELSLAWLLSEHNGAVGSARCRPTPGIDGLLAWLVEPSEQEARDATSPHRTIRHTTRPRDSWFFDVAAWPDLKRTKITRPEPESTATRLFAWAVQVLNFQVSHRRH